MYFKDAVSKMMAILLRPHRMNSPAIVMHVYIDKLSYDWFPCQVII